MRVNMLYRDREDLRTNGYLDKDDIVKDFNLEVIRKKLEEERKRTEEIKPKMADKDTYLENVFQRVLMVPLETPEEVCYRQGFMRDAMKQPELFEELYRIAKEAVSDIDKRKDDIKARKAASSGGYRGAAVMSALMYLKQIGLRLDELHEVLNKHEANLVSDEMKAFVQDFHKEYHGQFIEDYRKIMDDMEGILNGRTLVLGSTLGNGLKQTNLYIKEIGKKENPLNQLNKLKTFFSPNTRKLSGEEMIDDAGKLRDAAVSYVLHYFDGFLADKEEFFKRLRFQSAFYTCGAWLYRCLHSYGVTVCFPEVVARKDLYFEKLTELSLCLHIESNPIENDLDSMDKWLLVVTGANQGGKSTYLRSIGIAQMFMQAGLFVTASQFKSGLYHNIFTHFTRREDSAMNSGRLVEELQRMDTIMQNITEDSILFLNESFATTTEKEGSVIAWDISKALYESGVRVLTVTHLLEYAKACYEEQLEHAIFLSAERKGNGERTYRIKVSEPEMTSYGLDLYETMIGTVDKGLLENISGG